MSYHGATMWSLYHHCIFVIEYSVLSKPNYIVKIFLLISLWVTMAPQCNHCTTIVILLLSIELSNYIVKSCLLISQWVTIVSKCAHYKTIVILLLSIEYWVSNMRYLTFFNCVHNELQWSHNVLIVSPLYFVIEYSVLSKPNYIVKMFQLISLWLSEPY